MGVQGYASELRGTWGESMFPYKDRIPESGSWAATIFLWVMAVLGALCGVWPWAVMMALISLGVCPPLNQAGASMDENSLRRESPQ
jgi:hypothetical protein